MYLLWHLLTTIVCAYECAVCLPQLRARFIRLIMFFGLGVIHGVAPLLTPIGYFFPGSTIEDINMAAFAAFIGVVMFSIGFRIYESWRPSPNGLSDSLIDWLERPETQRALCRLFWASLVIGGACLLSDWYLRAGSISALLRGGRFDYRFEGGLASVLLTHGQSLLFIPAFLGFFLSRRHRLIGLVYAIGMSILLVFAMKGTRHIALRFAGAPLLAYVLCFPLSPRRVVNLTAASCLLLILAVGVYEARKTMSRDTFAETMVRLVSPDTYSEALTRDPLNTHQFLVASVQHFPNEHDFLHGATYRRMLLFPIPGAWTGGLKPIDTNMVFARTISGRSTSLTTMMPSMMGDGWINLWGLPGVVLIMFLNGIAVAWMSERVLASPIWLIGLGPQFVGLVALALRGEPYEIFSIIAFAIAITWLIGRALGLQWTKPEVRPDALSESDDYESLYSLR